MRAMSQVLLGGAIGAGFSALSGSLPASWGAPSSFGQLEELIIQNCHVAGIEHKGSHAQCMAFLLGQGDGCASCSDIWPCCAVMHELINSVLSLTKRVKR